MTVATAARPRQAVRGWASRLFPGDRRVWLTAGVVGGLLLIGIAIWMAVPRAYYTGTNSVYTRSIVTGISDGQQLCVRGLLIPKETGRVQLEVDGAVARPALAGTVRVGGEVRSTRLPAAPAGSGFTRVEFAAPPSQAGAEASPGSICISAHGAGQANFGGMGGLQGDDIPPTLDGDEVDARVAAWFLPPEGRERSMLAGLPEILSRASLFRPGFVGPWTYWVLLFVVLPCLMYAAVRLLATADDPAPRRISRGASIFMLAAIGGIAWALITPSFDAPDESEHFAYAQYVAETGRAIDSSQGARPAYSTEELLALEGTRHFSYIESASGRPPWLKADEQRWKRRFEEQRPADDNGGGYSTAGSTHTPLFYALLAPAYLATDGQSTFSQLAAMRLISALLGGIVALCAYLIVRELFPRRRLPAVAAGLLVAFQPMFGFMSGAVNNDMGVNAAGAVLLYLLIRGLRRGLTVPTGIALGAVLVLAPLLKGTGLALYPAAALALLFMIWRRHERSDLLAYAAVVGTFLAFTVGWQLIAPLFERTTLSAAGEGAAAEGARDNIPGALSYLWQVFLPPLPFMTDLFTFKWPAFDIYVIRGWDAFGWYAISFPQWVNVLIVACMLVAGALAALALVRHRSRVWPRVPELLVLVGAVAGVVTAVHFYYYSPVPRPVLPEFGRYAFPAITALAVAAIGAAFALPRRMFVPALTVLVVLVLGFNYASRLLTLVGAYS